MDTDIPFSAEDRKRLGQALGTSWNDLAALLARAGASEILALATGRTVPATLADARAFRIRGPRAALRTSSQTATA